MYKLSSIGRIGKPLCVLSNDKLLVYRKGWIKVYNTNGEFNNVCKLPFGFLLNFAKLFRISERIARTEPRCAEVDFAGYLNICHCGKMITIDLMAQRIVATHIFRQGMLSPLNLVKITGINGFDNCLVYGEYWGNPFKEGVKVYAKYGGVDDWEVVYEFPPNTIRHIHNIIPDRKRSCLYILTGDDDAESGIWEARENFKHVTPLFVGKQIYRSCVAIPVEDGLIYATDAPTENNGLYLIRYSDQISDPQLLFDLPGTVIYGGVYKNRLIFSTAVEPDPKYQHRFFRFMFTYKLGAGIKDKYTHMYILDEDNMLSEIVEFKKDYYPPALCQYGTIMFAIGDKDTYLYPVSVQNNDGSVYLLGCQ